MVCWGTVINVAIYLKQTACMKSILEVIMSSIWLEICLFDFPSAEYIGGPNYTF
jgi:hypothetical protein